jgi:hypothetical protein
MRVRLSPLAQNRLDKGKKANPDILVLYEALRNRLAHDPYTGAIPVPSVPHNYVIAIPPHSPRVSVEVIAQYEIASDGTVMIRNLIFR